MADTVSVHPTRTRREERGLALFRERGAEIEHIRGPMWLVPSENGDYPYVADLERQVCECPDRAPEGEVCKHVTAATIARGKTEPCAGCHRRFRGYDLHEAPEDNLTFFEGDLLCERCAGSHGVI